MTYLSVIIPSYKSASVLRNNLPYLLKYLDAKNKPYEVIIVDDGSNDNGETEKSANELGCQYLHNVINEGKGSAVKKGMLHAKGKYRMFTDADIPFETEAFDRFLHYLDNRQFDVVVGDRTLNGSSYFKSKSMLRNVASRWFSFIVGNFVAGNMFDTQCGIKGFRADVAKDIFGVSRINSFTFDVEILYIALKRNYDIRREPVVLRSQEGTSVNVMLHSFNMMFDLLKIKWNHVKKRYEKIKPV
jgi:dolichyl-phosphate beta-glucosyltransferase